MKNNIIVLLLAAGAFGCEEKGKLTGNTSNDGGTSSSSKPASSAMSAAASASASGSGSAAPATKVPKGDLQAKAAEPQLIKKGVHSNVPTVEEYKSQFTPANVIGAKELDCETRLVREWLRVSCRGTNAARGTAELVTVVKGDTMQHTFHVFSSDDVTSLVMRLEPGVDLKAIYRFSTGEHIFETRWAEGAEESEVKGFFDGGSVVLNAPPSGGAAAPAVAGEPPYGTSVPERSTVPTEEEYRRQYKEVTVTNSTLLQCETKKVREWLRVRCFGTNSARGAATAIRVLTGSDKPGVFAFMESNAATLIMPFLPNTKLLAEFTFSTGIRLFNSEWVVGEVEPSRCGWF